MDQKKIIQNVISSLYMKNVASRKGWTKQEVAYKVVEYLTCSKAISLYDFMENIN
jgi:hypothetical protein